jgi:hypothetical protein
MKRTAANIVREYGPFPAITSVHDRSSIEDRFCMAGSGTGDRDGGRKWLNERIISEIDAWL